MSTILEALRKSEAERADALGEAEMAPAPEPPSRRLRPVAAVVVVILLAAAAWHLLRPGAEPGPAPAARPPLPEAQVAAGAAPASPVDGSRAADPTAGDDPAAADTTPIAPGRRPRGSLSNTLPTALDGPPVATAPVETMDPALLGPGAGSGEDLTPLDLTPEIITRPVVDDPPPRPRTVDVAGAGAAARSPAAEPVEISLPAPVRRSGDEQAAGGLPSAYAMPPGPARTQLERLKLNMHVYAEDPSARFVLIDLRRYAAGDDLGGGLRIARIAPQGVVLASGGSEWLWAPR